MTTFEWSIFVLMYIAAFMVGFTGFSVVIRIMEWLQRKRK